MNNYIDYFLTDYMMQRYINFRARDSTNICCITYDFFVKKNPLIFNELFFLISITKRFETFQNTLSEISN